MKKLPLLIFILLSILSIAHTWHYYPELPEKVASHFNGSGIPDGWSSKNKFITFHIIVISTTIALFLGLTFGISKTPTSLINIPNKDYWLSDGRKAESFKFMVNAMLWFGSATLLLILDIFHQSIQVNLKHTDHLTHPFISLGLYSTFAIIWCVLLFKRFSLKNK